MQRHMRVKAALAGVAVAGGAAVAALGPASPALGFYSPPLLLQVHVNSPAPLVAKGAGAEVSVTVQCAGAQTASVTVGVTERAGSDIATGSGSAQVGCTNANETIQVLVTAQAGKAFKKGTAVATAAIDACTANFSVCGSERDQETIDLTH